MREVEPGVSRRFGLLEDSRRGGYGTQRCHQVGGPSVLLLFAAAVSNTY